MGCLLYEMASLEPAYANVGTDMFGAMSSIMEGNKPALVEGYSDDLNATISECLNSEPQTRPTIEDLQARSNAKMEALVEGYKGENITHLVWADRHYKQLILTTLDDQMTKVSTF